MKKKGYRAFLAGVLLAVLAVAGLPAAALAAESLQVELPSVEIKLEGTAPSLAEGYQIVLEAGNPSYPMPEGSADGKYTLTITGSGTASFPDISYSKPGVYSYTIYQVKGSNSQCTYDETVYTMTVYITNKADGSGLESAVKVEHPDRPNTKNMEIVFTNKYPPAPGPDNPTPTPTPPDDPDDPTPPPGPTDDPDDPTPPPADPDNPNNPDGPQTGDSSHLWLYVCLGAVSLIVLVALFLTKRRKSDQ